MSIRSLLILHIAMLIGDNSAVSSEMCENTNQITKITGAGSAFPAPIYAELGAKYAASRIVFARKVDFSFIRVNSGYGRRRITFEEDDESDPVNFAASEGTMTAEQVQMYPNLVTFPILAGALVIIYNVPEASLQNRQLTLDLNTIGKIYIGSVTHWNDSMIQNLNPTITLPYERIRPTVRADSSGDTGIFTDAMFQAAGEEWKTQFGEPFSEPDFSGKICCDSRRWANSSSVEFYADRVTGMIGIIGSIKYTIGYAALANVHEYEIPYAKLINSLGEATEPTRYSIQQAMDALIATKSKKEPLTFSLNVAPGQDAYPLASFSYMILNVSTHPAVDCCQSMELFGLINYLLSNDQYLIATYDKYSLVPLSSTAKMRVLQIANKMTCLDQSVPDAFMETLIVQDKNEALIYVLTAALVTLALISMAIGTAMWYKHKVQRMSQITRWYSV